MWMDDGYSRAALGGLDFSDRVIMAYQSIFLCSLDGCWFRAGERQLDLSFCGINETV